MTTNAWLAKKAHITTISPEEWAHIRTATEELCGNLLQKFTRE